MKDKKLKYLAIFLVLVALIIIPLTYSKYIKRYTKQLTISAIQPTYQVVFDPNGGSGDMDPQTFTYKTPQNLTLNAYTNGTLVFDKWNTEDDGSGDDYEDGQEVNNLVSTNGGSITLYAQWVDKAAKIGNKYYDTLALAVDDVYASSPETTIILLKDVTENITIPKNVHIILDLNHKTIYNDGNDNNIKNHGTLTLKNGNIHNDAETNGGVNNYNDGTITIDGVNITVDGTGGRQAFYNEGGISTIKGGSVLTTIATERPCVTNKNNGTMTILDATIISTGQNGVSNEGTRSVLTIGSDDGTVEGTPIIQGKNNGLNTALEISFYDGIIKGRNRSVNNPGNITTVATGYYPKDGTEVIDGVTYRTKYLEPGLVVTFDGNGGTPSVENMTVESGHSLGTMPTASYTGFELIGWFTDPEGGEEITGSTIINESMTVYAHYVSTATVTVTFDGNGGTPSEASRTINLGLTLETMPTATYSGHRLTGWFTEATGGDEVTGSTVINESMTVYAHYSLINAVASINGVEYESIQDAINHASNNATIVLLKDHSEHIDNTKNITLDLGGHTLRNSGSNPIITNNGTLTVQNGTLRSNARQSAINQESGTLNMFSGSIYMTSDRQTIYVSGGTANLGGSIYLSSMATGTPENNPMERGTIHCLANGTVNLTGGTIIGINQQAISNEGILNIGSDDGTIDTTTPVIQGNTYGIKSIGMLNIYDGIIKGKTAAINGTVSEIEDDSHWVNTTEVIDSNTYYVDYLELD